MMANGSANVHWTRLLQWFPADKRVAVAFSGGVDSSLVLAAAVAACGPERVTAFTADSPSLARKELAETKELAATFQVAHQIIETGELENSEYVRNDGSRCFHCKTELYRALVASFEQLAFDPGQTIIVDGLNQDDLSDERPGRIAADRAGVRHPLVEAEIDKKLVRELALQAGLPNWNKPAMACLASRIARGTAVSGERLSLVEHAELALGELGFSGVRVRLHLLPGAREQKLARIELQPGDTGRLLEAGAGYKLSSRLRELGFDFVTLDLEGYKLGGNPLSQ